MFKKDGFTLIELLVVIIVVGVLASLILPAISSTKENAKRMACLNNMRQIYIGLEMYAQDHDGKMPGYPTELFEMNPTWQGYSDCIISRTLQKVGSIVIVNFGFLYSSYIDDPNVFNCPANPVKDFAKKFITQDSLRTSYIFTAYRDFTGLNQAGSMVITSDFNPDNSFLRLQMEPGKYATNHLTGYNKLYGDGHIEWVNTEKYKRYP